MDQSANGAYCLASIRVLLLISPVYCILATALRTRAQATTIFKLSPRAGPRRAPTGRRPMPTNMARCAIVHRRALCEGRMCWRDVLRQLYLRTALLLLCLSCCGHPRGPAGGATASPGSASSPRTAYPYGPHASWAAGAGYPRPQFGRCRATHDTETRHAAPPAPRPTPTPAHDASYTAPDTRVVPCSQAARSTR